ncbi:unnamed protein product [Auanema sp. JU1783]|nr:unnamed protein product [Auanema sp. JU1783]
MTVSEGSETEEAVNSGRTTSVEERQSRSCSRTENATAFVTSEGFLDLSNIGLTALSSDFQHEYSITKELDVSKNNLKACNLSLFNICRKINISENSFTSLSSLLPSSRKLDTIIACDNEIRITSKIQDFIALSSLRLCKNSIKNFPCSKLNNLRFLDLSDNMISEFPDLTHMPNLETLLLANNRIKSLKHTTQCKSNLKVLDISANPIMNLCEVYHLEKMKDITNFSLKDTPCLSVFEEYHYKSFLVVLFPCILFINNMDVLEIESFNAEFLTLRGNLTGLHSKFSSSLGDNETLAAYLKEHSVQMDNSGRMPKDDKLYKDAIELMTTDDDLSVHSPFGNYIAQLGKENHCPRTLETKSKVMNISLNSAHGSRHTDFHDSNSSISLNTPVLSSDSHRSQLDICHEYRSSEETSLGTLTPTLKTLSPEIQQQKAKVLDSTFTKEDKEEIHQMKAVIDDLYKSNVKLYMVQDIISETMRQMDDINKERMNELHRKNGILEERCRNLEEKLASLELKAKGPIPIIQRASRQCNDEEIGLNWHASFVKGYNLIMDGSVIGTVKGTSAKVTDVGTGDHHLQVQTVLLDGTLGEVSDEILVPDEKV